MHARQEERAVDRGRPVARPDAAQARRGLPEAAQHRPAVRRGRDLPQSFHPDRAVRAGARQPADRPLHDESPGGAEHHSARRSLHQPGARAAPRRLRSRPGRLHHDHARSAPHRAQRSALLRAGRHHGGLPFGRLVRESRCLFRLGRKPGLQDAQAARGHLAAARHVARRRDGRAGRHSRRSSPTPPGSPSAACPTCAAMPASRGSCISATTARIRRSSRPRPTTRCTGPEDMPKVVRASSPAEEAKQNALLAHYVKRDQAGELLPGRQGAGLGDERGRGGADARHLLRPDERDRRSSRPRLRLPEGDRPVGRHADRLHLRSRRAARATTTCWARSATSTSPTASP